MSDFANTPTQVTPRVEHPTATVTSPPPPTEGGNTGTQVQSHAPTHLFNLDALPVVPGLLVSREIARGGMGAVYAVHDPTFDREVAVKVMHPGQNSERFAVEAKVTAQLPHPGIPPVYTLGLLADGRPFLTMKLIQGRTLADELNVTNRVSDLPRFLGAFEQICLTVGFAHSRGIIHRDLKPTNVMVGSFGEVLVMDWGLAKSAVSGQETEESETTAPQATQIVGDTKTQAGQVKGTPAYMAPEQARGEPVDARADVFALGGILAVTLTGKPPFWGDTVMDTVLRAAQAELDECFAQLSTCTADAELVAVAKRCLAATPADRYSNAEEVAAAIAAYRTGVEQRLRRAEQDRAVSAAEAREQRKRRRVQLSLAASVLLMVCGAGGTAWWLDREATERKRAAEFAAERTETERRETEERQKRAAEFAAERTEAERRATEERQKMEKAFRWNLTRQSIKASLALASDLRKQFKFKQADAALLQAEDMALIEQDSHWRWTAAQARRDLAFVVKLDDIRFRKWIWIAEDGGAGHFNTKIASVEYRKAFAGHNLDLTSREPANAVSVIAASSMKADIVAAVDDWALHEPDEKLRNRLLEIARRANRANPGSWTDRLRDPAIRADKSAITKLAAEVNLDTAPATLSLLVTLMERHRLDATPLLQAARARHPSDFELAFALGQSQMSNVNAGRQIGAYEAARAIRPDNMVVWNNLGLALEATGEIDGAILAFQEAIRLDPAFSVTHVNLGHARSHKGDTDGAIAEYREAIRLDPKYALAHYNLAVALRSKGNTDGAIAEYKETIRHEPTFARAHTNLGLLLKAKGNLNGAIAAYEEAIRLDPKEAMPHNNLGLALKAKGDRKGALAAFREALRLDPKCAHAHNNLGLMKEDDGDVDGAISSYKEAIRHDAMLPQPHIYLGTIYFIQKKYPEAVVCARDAIKADPTISNAHALLGMAFQQMGDIPAARSALNEAVRLDRRWAPQLARLPPLGVAPPPREVKK